MQNEAAQAKKNFIQKPCASKIEDASTDQIIFASEEMLQNRQIFWSFAMKIGLIERFRIALMRGQRKLLQFLGLNDYVKRCATRSLII